MKKILSLLLCGIMVISLTGCGNDSDKEGTKQNDVQNVSDETTNNEDIQNYHEDNQELVDAFNNAVSELYDEAKEENYFSLALYKIMRKLDESGIDQYTAVALCDKAFEEEPIITGYTSPNWTSDASNIENYTGTCTYDTVEFTKYNDGDDYNVLVLDNTTNNYYNVTISFKEIEFNGDVRYYPTFVNSKLLQ